MPLIDLNVMLGGKKTIQAKTGVQNTFFTAGFNGKGLWTSGIPSQGHAGHMESKVRETGIPSLGNFSFYFSVLKHPWLRLVI